MLFRLGELLRDHQDEIARIVTMEEGKPLAEARGEVAQAYNTAMYYAGEGRRMWSLVVPAEQQQKLTFTVRQPLGVVAVITPWNFPSMIPMWNLAPALVTGNAVVFKPASHTPLTALRMTELFVEAGIPEGVFNLVTGPGGTTGEALVNNPDVDVVAFTGETFTGRHISEINARFLRRQVLELGGKNPLIVAGDAKMDVTVGAALWSAFSNTGQKCTAASRIIVEEPAKEAFTRKFVKAANKLRVGDGLDDGVEVGPLVSEPGLDKTKRYVEIGQEEGAELLAGGQGYDDARKGGFFHQPTVFAGTNDMRISQDEIFGPVTNIMPAADLEEAMEFANDVRYGLASSIYTTDLRAAFDAVGPILVQAAEPADVPQVSLHLLPVWTHRGVRGGGCRGKPHHHAPPRSRRQVLSAPRPLPQERLSRPSRRSRPSSRSARTPLPSSSRPRSVSRKAREIERAPSRTLFSVRDPPATRTRSRSRANAGHGGG